MCDKHAFAQPKSCKTLIISQYRHSRHLGQLAVEVKHMCACPVAVIHHSLVSGCGRCLFQGLLSPDGLTSLKLFAWPIALFSHKVLDIQHCCSLSAARTLQQVTCQRRTTFANAQNLFLVSLMLHRLLQHVTYRLRLHLISINDSLAYTIAEQEESECVGLGACYCYCPAAA